MTTASRDFTFLTKEDKKPTEGRDFTFLSKEQMKPQEESAGKSALRTALQPVIGYLQATVPGIIGNLWQFLATGEALDPEEIDRIEAIALREGVPFDREKYMEAAQTAISYIPSVGNIARMLEEKTGVPLEAKTPLQKALSLGTSAAKFQPGSLAQKAVAGVAAPAASFGLTEAGVPEPLAELGGLVVGGAGGALTPGELSLGAAKKPSGLTARQFEAVSKPREVPESRLGKINKAVESDFRQIADDIFEKSPSKEIKAALKDDVGFKQAVREDFKRVEELAENIPEKINTSVVKKDLVDNVLKKKGTGFAPGEYDKDFRKFITDFIKETPSQEITAQDLVVQFRKNNKELSGAYDPSRSYNYNRAKKDALLEYNRAIARTIDNVFPETQFSNLFKTTNEQWSRISDVEAVDKFVDSLFDGKIRFEKGKRFFENENVARPFKRALGEENFKQFEGLMKDLMTSETPYRMLKVAKKQGFRDLAETAAAFVLHPTLGKARLGYQMLKKTKQAVSNALLDKPQLAFTWKSAVDNLKKGKFKEAEKDFKNLKAEVEVLEKEPEVRTETPEEVIDITENVTPRKSTSPKKLTTGERRKELEFKLEAPSKKPSKKKAPEDIPLYADTRGKGFIFHGSPVEIDSPSYSHYSDKNIYGQGFYTTDALDIASGYASRKGKAKEPTLYQVAEKRPVKLFDMEKPIPRDIKIELENLKGATEIKENLSENPNQTLRELYDNIRGMSQPGEISSDTVQELFDIISEHFRRRGYDGYKHIGGLLTKNEPHEVKIYFDPEKTVSLKKFRNPYFEKS